MKLKKGLAAVLSLVISTSMIAFAQEDITKSEQTKTPKPIEVLAEEQIIQEPTRIEQLVVQPPKDVPEVEVPSVVVPPVAEEPEVEESPVVVPPTKEPEVVMPPVAEEPPKEPEVVMPPLVEIPAEVLVVPLPVVDVKPATLKIVNKLLTGEGAEDIVVEEEIKDLVAGQVIDMSNYLHEDEFVKLVDRVENIKLKEGQNEIIVEYKFREDIEVISATENTYRGENIK